MVGSSLNLKFVRFCSLFHVRNKPIGREQQSSTELAKFHALASHLEMTSDFLF